MTLTVAEFMRRFLLHVLPHGFHRIRHYGLLANAARVENLARARALLQIQPPPVLAIPERNADEPVVSAGPLDWHRCPCCGALMMVIETFARNHPPRAPPDSQSASPTSAIHPLGGPVEPRFCRLGVYKSLIRRRPSAEKSL
jgi:hypothetical protein